MKSSKAFGITAFIAVIGFSTAWGFNNLEAPNAFFSIKKIGGTF